MSLFQSLDALRHRQIGDQDAARAARKGYRTRIAIDRGHALSGENLVEARELGLKGENFYAGARNPPYWQRVDGATDRLLVRQNLGEKLRKVNARAAQAGLELFLYDAWR